jgi:hypothetical protein
VGAALEFELAKKWDGPLMMQAPELAVAGTGVAK